MLNYFFTIILCIKKRFIFNYSLVSQVIRTIFFTYRINNKHMKNRSRLNYSTRKLFPQKGLGHSRKGSRSNPIFRGGGRCFSNSKCLKKKNNKKMYFSCLKNLILKFLFENKIYFLKKITLKKPSSNYVFKFIKDKYYSCGKTLFISDKFDSNLFLSFRNINKYFFITYNEMNPIYFIKFDTIIFFYNCLGKLISLYENY